MRRGALFRSGAASMLTFDAAPAATRPETFGSGLLRPLYRRIPVSVPGRSAFASGARPDER